MPQLEFNLRKKYLAEISSQLMSRIEPAKILKQLIENYINQFSLFTTLRTFFTTKNATNINFAKRLLKLLSHPDDFDHILSIIRYLQTNPILVQDDLIPLLGAFFSLSEKYSIFLPENLKTKLGVEDIFSPVADSYLEHLIKKEQWERIADLDFIPENKLLTGAESLLTQKSKIVIQVLNKFGHLFSDLKPSHVIEKLSQKLASTPINNKKIRSLLSKWELPSTTDQWENKQSQDNILFRIKWMIFTQSSFWYRFPGESSQYAKALSLIRQLKPLISDEIKPEILRSILLVLKKQQNSLGESSQSIYHVCFDVLNILGEIYTQDNVSITLGEEIIETLVSFLQNNPQDYYIEEGAIKSLSALHAMIPLSKRNLVVTKIATHLPRFNELLFPICSKLKSFLTKDELIALVSKWSSWPYFETVKTAQDALPLVTIIPEKKYFSP